MKHKPFLSNLLLVWLLLQAFHLSGQPEVWCMPSWECASDITLRHKGYAVSYDPVHKIPVWVAYYLVPARMQKASGRTNDFRPDPFIPLQFSATNGDYKASGYDRGHLAPAADMSWSADVMSESFYFSNMTPQEPGFNRGIWKKLEDQVRQWAKSFDTLLIVTGPLPDSFKGYIGPGRVAVPAAFYKAIVAWQNHSARGIAFVIPNTSSTLPIATFALTIDSLETLLSCNLFAALPEPSQQVAESQIDWIYWGISFYEKQPAIKRGSRKKK